MKKSNVTRAMIRGWLQNGGATLSRAGRPVDFSTGYQVSRMDCYNIPAGAYGDIAAAVREVLARLQPGDFCGLWESGGRVCVDVSVRILDRAEAIALGRAYNQRAIFDWSTKTDIILT